MSNTQKVTNISRENRTYIWFEIKNTYMFSNVNVSHVKKTTLDFFAIISCIYFFKNARTIVSRFEKYNFYSNSEQTISALKFKNIQ